MDGELNRRTLEYITSEILKMINNECGDLTPEFGCGIGKYIPIAKTIKLNEMEYIMEPIYPIGYIELNLN